MTPSWYDVLGVAPDATTDEIRTAWRAGVEGLDPTDRLFRQRNRAAEVLLDPQRRAAHDADLTADDDHDDHDDLVDEVAAGDDVPPVAVPVVTPTTGSKTSSKTGSGTGPAVSEPRARSASAGRERAPKAPRGARGSSVGVLTGVLAVLAVALLALTVFVAVNHGDGASATTAASGSAASGGLPDQTDIENAESAAKSAIAPVLSYDYRTLAADQKMAESYMTPAFASEYSQYFSVVRGNAPRTQTVVKAQVLDTGVVRTAAGRVDVLLFVNRPTTNKQTTTTYHDQVTARMVDTDGAWLVDCLITQPNGTCGH